MAEWLPPAQGADAALLPALRLGNARADDLVRNNGIAANAVALHKDHIVGHMFLISYRPNWRWLGGRTPGGKFTRDPLPASTSIERKIILTDMVRNSPSMPIDFHPGPQETVPHTVSRRVHPFRTHGFKTCTE